MVHKNFSNYDIDIDKETIYSKHFKRQLKINKNKAGYKKCSIIDDFGNKYYFWHEVVYCISHNITRDEIPVGENGDRYEIDHIIPVREGGTDAIENLRLVSHKGNMNNENTIKWFSKISKGNTRGYKKGNVPFMKGKHHSEESKRKMSESRKGNNNWLGKYHSEVTKEKISKAMKGNKNWLGKHHTEESNEKNRKSHSKKVYQYTIDGLLVATWPSAKEAGKNGYNESAINHCCNGLNKTHK